MFYRRLEDLPQGLRHLPPAARQAYQHAYNRAWERFEDDPASDDTPSTFAHRIGWAAVLQRFERLPDGSWHRRS